MFGNFFNRLNGMPKGENTPDVETGHLAVGTEEGPILEGDFHNLGDEDPDFVGLEEGTGEGFKKELKASVDEFIKNRERTLDEKRIQEIKDSIS